MTERTDIEKIHASLDALGMRAAGSAAGLVQLLRELLYASVLDEPAIRRVEEAIIADIGFHRPRSLTQAEFEANVRERLDQLLALPSDRQHRH